MLAVVRWQRVGGGEDREACFFSRRHMARTGSSSRVLSALPDVHRPVSCIYTHPCTYLQVKCLCTALPYVVRKMMGCAHVSLDALVKKEI